VKKKGPFKQCGHFSKKKEASAALQQSPFIRQVYPEVF
jgi:hypothetical protein